MGKDVKQEIIEGASTKIADASVGLIKGILGEVISKAKGGLANYGDQLRAKAAAAILKVKKVSPMEHVCKLEDSIKTYLSKSMTTTLKTKLEIYKEKLEDIPYGTDISEYKNESLKVVKSLLDELENYDKYFDVFINGENSRFPRSNKLNYYKMLQARKSMKYSLKDMKELLEKYTDGGKYTYKSIANELQRSVTESRENAKQLLAKKFYVTAFNLIKDHIIGDIEVNDPSPGAKKGDKIRSKGVMEYADMLKANEGDASLHADLKEAVNLVEGVASMDYGKDEPPDFDKNSTSAGARRCLSKAEKVLNDISTKDPYELNGLEAKPPFMGDCAERIQNIVKFTLPNLNKVINLGANTKDLYDKDGNVNPKFEPSKEGLGVDLKTLLGDDYKQWENQKKILDTAIQRDLAKNMRSIHDKVEKEYKQIQKHLNKYKKDIKDKKVPTPNKDDYGDFLELKVKVPSKKGDTGFKLYDIKENYEGNLNKYYTNALSGSLSKEYTLHYIREAEKCLRGCDAWNEKRPEYEEWLESLKIKAEETINRSKEHYDALRKQINDFYKGKKEQKKKLNDTLKLVNQEYKKLVLDKSKFMKNYNESEVSHYRFNELKLGTDGKLFAVYKRRAAGGNS